MLYEVITAAIKFAHDAIRIHCKAQEELAAEAGKPKREYCHEVNDEALRDVITSYSIHYTKLYEVVSVDTDGAKVEEILDQVFVITSYSIHYTKLYDTMLKQQ